MWKPIIMWYTCTLNVLLSVWANSIDPDICAKIITSHDLWIPTYFSQVWKTFIMWYKCTLYVLLCVWANSIDPDICAKIITSHDLWIPTYFLQVWKTIILYKCTNLCSKITSQATRKRTCRVVLTCVKINQIAHPDCEI